MTDLDERQSLDRMARALRHILTPPGRGAVPTGAQPAETPAEAAPQPGQPGQQPPSGEKR